MALGARRMRLVWNAPEVSWPCAEWGIIGRNAAALDSNPALKRTCKRLRPTTLFVGDSSMQTRKLKLFSVLIHRKF